jgi:hypothetical protein
MSPLYLEYVMREDAREREEVGQKIRGTERARRGAISQSSRPPGAFRRHLARRLVSLGLYLDPWAR